jgi:Hsp70 protein
VTAGGAEQGTRRRLRLAVDFGSSTTVAAVVRLDGGVAPLLFGGSPLLPSAVFAETGGDLLVGQDAWLSARVAPERFEPNPKRRIDDGDVLLGDREVPVTELIAAVYSRVAAEAVRVAGAPVGELTLTYPVAWGGPRRAVLERAARVAGLPAPRFVPEPVAAAAHFTAGAYPLVRPGGHAVVYDFGAGTFDATVVRRTAAGFDVLANAGLPDVGGLDLDAAIMAHLGDVYAARDPQGWRRLMSAASTTDRRALRQLWDDVRAAKEMLSRTSSAFVPLPGLAVDAPIGREKLEELAAPLLLRTVRTTAAAMTRAAVPGGRPDLVLLVGGSSRMPAVATELHRATGIAPTAVEWPELVVAEGALRVPAVAAAAPPVAAAPAAGRPRPPVSRVQPQWSRPAAVGLAAAVAVLLGALLADRSARQAAGVGLLAPLSRPLYPLLAAATLTLGLLPFAHSSHPVAALSGKGRLAWPAMASIAMAAGFTVAQSVLAAIITAGFVSRVIQPGSLAGRGGPLVLGALVAGVGAAALGVWLLAGIAPADPLEPPADRLGTARRLAAAAGVGAVCGVGAHTHLYGNRWDATTGAIVTDRATDDPVLFLARTFGQPVGPLAQLAHTIAFTAGVAAVFWLLTHAALAARRFGPPARTAARRYGAGAAAGLLVAAGLYLGYHAARETRYWSGWRLRAAGWVPAADVSDRVIQSVNWLWSNAGPPLAVVTVLFAAVGALWPPHRFRRR